MKCWDCPHFKIQYKPIGKISTGIWDFGRAKCTKHDMVVDFPNHKKLKKLECIEAGRNGEVGMKWEQYEKQMPIKSKEWQYKTQVDVECPKCGKKIWRRNDIVLTSYPAQYQYECECGWVGYAFI